MSINKLELNIGKRDTEHIITIERTESGYICLMNQII